MAARRPGWALLLGTLFAAITFICPGCDTPYTKRVGQLDETYQHGDLSREDYMRFVHEAETWETR